MASFLSRDSLFVCIGGVNAIGGLRQTLLDLGVTEAVEAMDMDQLVNPQVRAAVLAMRKEVQRIPGIKYSKYTWNRYIRAWTIISSAVLPNIKMEVKIMEHINFKQVMGSSQDGENVLGKFLYFSLSNILIEKEQLSELCDSMGILYAGGSRVSVSDAFRSATGDIKERIVTKEYGETGFIRSTAATMSGRTVYFPGSL